MNFTSLIPRHLRPSNVWFKKTSRVLAESAGTLPNSWHMRLSSSSQSNNHMQTAYWERSMVTELPAVVQKASSNSIRHSWDEEKDIYLPSVHFGLLIYQFYLQTPSLAVSGKWWGSPETHWTCPAAAPTCCPKEPPSSVTVGGTTQPNLQAQVPQQAFLKTLTVKN